MPTRAARIVKPMSYFWALLVINIYLCSSLQVSWQQRSSRAHRNKCPTIWTSGLLSAVANETIDIYNAAIVQQTRRQQMHQDMRDVLASRQQRRRHVEADAADTPDDRWSRARRPTVLTHDTDGAERVHQMLQHLVARQLATPDTFDIVLQAYANRGRSKWQRKQSVVKLQTGPPQQSSSTIDNNENNLVCAADVSLELCRQLRELFPVSEVPVAVYEPVLRACAGCASPRQKTWPLYAHAAHELWQWLQASYPVMVPMRYQHYVLQAYCWQQANCFRGNDRATDTAPQCQELLDDLVAKGDESDDLTQCYSYVIEAWSKSSRPDSAERAESLLFAMNSGSNGADLVMADPDAIGNVIISWTKHGNAKRALELLQLYKSIVTGSGTSDEAERFENSNVGQKLPVICFNSVMILLARQRHCRDVERVWDWMQHCRVAPDIKSYNALLSAYCRTSRTSNMEDAMKVWQTLNSDDSVAPNAYTYQTMLHGWARTASDCADAVPRAEQLMQKLKVEKQISDSIVFWNLLLNVYAKHRDSAAIADKAVDVLYRLKTRADVQPDVVTYTTVLECLAHSGNFRAPSMALALLDELLARNNESQDDSLLPNTRTFTMAILTLARNDGAPAAAQRLLNQLVSLHETTGDDRLTPSSFAYNYVLQCASNAVLDKAEAFNVAANTLQAMRRSSVTTNSFTYAFWFKCCGRLLPTGDLRQRHIEQAFHECCEQGQLSAEVLRRLIQAATPKLLSALLCDKLGSSVRVSGSPEALPTVTLRDLPASWSRNVK